MKIKRKCILCGKLFNALPSLVKKGYAKYCSRKCQFKGQIKGKYNKCKVCGKKYFAVWARIKKGKVKYCSMECLHKGIRKGKIHKCPVCGKKFYRYKSWKGLHCSWKCANIGKSEKILRKCQFCGKGFLVKPSRIKMGWGKYCSHACFYSDTNKIKKICTVCKKEFFVSPSSLKYRRTGDFCSYKCRGKYQTADKNPQYVDGRSSLIYSREFQNRMRKAVNKIYKDKCQICGKVKAFRRAVHHIDFDRNNDSLDNLILYCQKCHSDLHGVLSKNVKQKRKISKRIKTASFRNKYHNAHFGRPGEMFRRIIRLYKSKAIEA